MATVAPSGRSDSAEKLVTIFPSPWQRLTPQGCGEQRNLRSMAKGHMLLSSLVFFQQGSGLPVRWDLGSLKGALQDVSILTSHQGKSFGLDFNHGGRKCA